MASNVHSYITLPWTAALFSVSLKAARVDFWRATMHKYGVSCNDNDDLIEYIDVIDSFARDYGYLFKEQSAKRISAVLSMLDDASSDWDKTEPHVFYCLLKEKFPSSLRENKAVQLTMDASITTNKHPKKRAEESQISAIQTAFLTVVVIVVIVAIIIFTNQK
ncbi:MAG: hypothetical protein ACFUZC_22600 [Chthoniobacteraceae bacterium]